MRTLDQIVQEHFGQLQFVICQLQADNEALKARIAALETPKPPDLPPAP